MHVSTLLSREPSKVARREELRKNLREALLHDQENMQRLLAQPPTPDPVVERVQENENFVMLQQRARNPDTLLLRRLLHAQSAYLTLFREHAEYLSACRAAKQTVNQIFARKAARDAKIDMHSLLDYQCAYRVSLALQLASSILTERGSSVPGLRVQVGALELLALLDPDIPELDMLESARAQLIGFEKEKFDSTNELNIRRASGYQVLKGSAVPGALAAVHAAGALLLFQPGAEPVEVDLCLLTNDKNQFPNPQALADVLLLESGYPSCIYIDFNGRELEAEYDETSGCYALVSND